VSRNAMVRHVSR